MWPKLWFLTYYGSSMGATVVGLAIYVAVRLGLVGEVLGTVAIGVVLGIALVVIIGLVAYAFKRF